MLVGKHFRKYYLKYAYFFIIGVFVLIAVDWLQLEVPRIIGQIIDALRDTSPDTVAIENGIKRIIYLALVIAAGRFLWRYTIFGASRRIEYQLQNVMFKQSTLLSQSFYSQNKVGGLMTYYINDLQAVRMAFGPGILMLFDGLFMGGFALYKMAQLEVFLTIIAASPMVILTVVMIFIRKSMSVKFKLRQKAFENLSDFTQESFSGITVVKAFVREAKEYMLFRQRNDELYAKHMGFVKHMVLVNILISVAINVVVLLIIVVGSVLAIYATSAQLTGGQLTEYIGYFFSLIWPTMALSRFIQIQSQAKASAERIEAFLDHEIDVKDHPEAVYAEELKGSIQAKNLTFQYPDGDIPVLKNVNFEIKAGEMVGILGRTGSGKSSLVDLLLRVYNLEEGQMFLDGNDLMRLPIHQVRDTIGYVPQDNFLFSETISSNIGFAHQDPNRETIEQAAKYSDVYDNIMEFKHQFDTILGERGVTVSGGQKQRISIARALAKDPEILILDDSVSAVDTKTEDAIINNLHQLRKGRTTIFIAHRISTVKKMDKIILLDDGEVVAIGSHDELMKASTLYQDMVRRQQLENIVQGVDVA